MRCEECGRTLPEDAQFCANCGARAGMGARAQELVAMARTAGLTGTTGPGDVPPIPEPAELPEPPAPEAEYGMGLPEIPEPALLPGEEQPAADLAALTAAHVTQLSPRAQEAIERKRREAAEAERTRREAAAALVEQAELEIAQRAAAVPQHVGMAQMRDEREHAALPPPPPPPPPVPPSPYFDERVSVRPEHVSIAQALEAREQERATAVSEDGKEAIPAGRCCALGCAALAVVVLVLTLIGILARSA